MVEEEQIIFQINSSLVTQAFKGDNYKIEYDSREFGADKICVIYFSSNEIYYPNTSAAFKHSVIEKDRYEWSRNKFQNAKKHIFIRDIRKQWYIGGINTSLNSIPKLFEFLCEQIIGYKVYVIGSSAGGFAAILFGSLLNADRVYAFNAQMNLCVIIKNSNPTIDPLLFENLNNPVNNQYFDLSKFIKEGIQFYYFQSCYSKMDIVQYQSISKEARQNLKAIFFKTSNHGFPFLRNNLPVIFSLENSELEKLVNKKFHLILFSVRSVGFSSTFNFIFKALFDRYKKKKMEASFRINSTNNSSLV